MTTYKSIKYNFDGSNITGVLQSPTVSSISPSSDTEANLPTTITITGTNFKSNSTVTFVGASGTSIISPSVTFNSVTELEATAPVGIGGQNEDPWDVKIENPVTGQGDNLFTIDDNPIFATPAGTLGTIVDSSRGSYTLSPATATDPEGVTVTYALVAPGPAVSPGLSFDTTNAAITGTADAVGGDVTTSFVVRATAGAQTSDRIFSITVKGPVQTYFPTAGVGSVELAFTAPIKILVVAGGGGSGGTNNGGGGGGGLISHPSYNVTPQTYQYYVGSGGSGGSPGTGVSGQNSNWNSPSNAASTTANILTALGGGPGDGTAPAQDGGSGGGRPGTPGTVGLGIQTNSPLISADAKTYGFGNDGGNATPGAYPHPSGGGGGAGAVGSSPGAGGAGKDVSTDFGTAEGSPGGHFAGGGGGGTHTGGGAPGGTGGGGNYNVAGTNSTGGGGGAGASGGNGCIAVAY
jgi:hypothetical protein